MTNKTLTILTILIALTVTVSAWGSETQKYICEQAVLEVWGQETANKCLTYDQTLQNNLCDELENKVKPETYDSCRKDTELNKHVHPALIPKLFFKDPEQHLDYSVCNIDGPANQELMCGDPSYQPAIDNTELWLTRAVNAPDECTRVAYFCIASDYYSSSKFTLNNYQNLKLCLGDVEAKIDGLITDGEWQVNTQCTYEAWLPRAGRTVKEHHTQMFTLSSKTIDEVINYLATQGRDIKDAPYLSNDLFKDQATKSTTLSSTSTTQPVDETKIVMDETLKEIEAMFNDFLSLLESANDSESESKVQTGQGSFFVLGFMALVVIFCVIFALLVLIKIEHKRRKQPQVIATYRDERKTINEKKIIVQEPKPKPVKPAKKTIKKKTVSKKKKEDE